MNINSNIAYDPKLTQMVNQVVNQCFWGPMLREFRNSSQSTILDGGPGGDTFLRQLDQELLKRISQTGKAPLTDVLLQKLSSNNHNLQPATRNP